ncbi:HNH endonuclease, partial [Xanthomonas citri pv. citri]|nr:HNH endonuclease [Xanthomonas citri pv. citri]
SLHPRYVSLIRHKRRWKTLWDRIERSTTIA